MQSLTRNINHIILADDDDDDSMLFKEAIERIASSIQVSLAEDGQKLINFLEKYGIPDMIFLDLNMPRKNGIECLLEIRSNQRFDHIPVVMYSTSENKKDIEECYRGGASFYVVKPYSFESMISMLKNLFIQLPGEGAITAARETFLIKD